MALNLHFKAILKRPFLLAMIDIFLSKWTSRKFLVLVLATILLIFKIINQTTWLAIAIIYISVEGIPDAVERILKIIFKREE